MKTRKVVNFERPTKAPEGWEIYNAPRPLFGSEFLDGRCTWQGDFISGVFYAAIDPADPEADMWRKENQNLDATRLEFVSRQSVIDEMVTYYKTRYPTRFEKIFTENPLDNPKTQDMLIDTWFNLEMNRSE